MTCEPTKNIYPLRRKNMCCGVLWNERKSLTRHASLQVTETLESKKSFSLQVEGLVGPIWQKRKGKILCLAVLSRYRPVLPGAASMRPIMSDSVLITSSSCSHGGRTHQYTISVRPRGSSSLSFGSSLYLSWPVCYCKPFTCNLLIFPSAGTEGTKPSLRLRFDIEFDIDHRPTPRRQFNCANYTLPYNNSSQSERSIFQLVSCLLIVCPHQSV